MWPPIADNKKPLILLSVIQAGGSHCFSKECEQKMSFITFHNNIGHNLFTKVVDIFYMEDVISLISQIVTTFKWMVRRVIFQSISLRRQEDTSELSF